MRVLIFTILAVLLLPLILLGYLIFSGAFAAYVFHKISPELPMNPMVVACICVVGTRPDEAGYKLAWYLPSYGGIARLLIIDTLGLACKISGYKLWVFSYPGPRPSNMVTAISHRSYFFDESVKEALFRSSNPATQFVVLGSGFDTRCYDLPEGADIKCFEVDMAPTLNAKKRALELAGIAHEHVTFVETDFNQETWMEALLDSGLIRV